MKDKILNLFFSILFFIIFFNLIDYIFRNTLSIVSDILAIICLAIAFVASVALADYSVKKMNDK